MACERGWRKGWRLIKLETDPAPVRKPAATGLSRQVFLLPGLATACFESQGPAFWAKAKDDLQL